MVRGGRGEGVRGCGMLVASTRGRSWTVTAACAVPRLPGFRLGRDCLRLVRFYFGLGGFGLRRLGQDLCQVWKGERACRQTVEGGVRKKNKTIVIERSINIIMLMINILFSSACTHFHVNVW